MRHAFLPALALLVAACGSTPGAVGEEHRRDAAQLLSPSADSALTADAVASVDKLRWARHVRELAGETQVTLSTGETVTIRTRHSSTQGNTWAGQYIFDRLEELGWEVSFQPFQGPTGAERNVVATKVGSIRPDEIVVMGAHYDSTAPDASDAPGADDNASGVAAMLEAAEALADYDLDRTVKLVAFGGEEQGLYGSAAFVQRAQDNRDDIIGAVICDMVGWYDRRFSVTVEGGLRYADWMQLGVDAAQDWTTLDTRRSWYSFGSDHIPFQEARIPAFLIIEEEWFRAPHYHSSNDTWDIIEPELGYQASRMVVGALAAAAGLTGEASGRSLAAPTSADEGIIVVRHERSHEAACRLHEEAGPL